LGAVARPPRLRKLSLTAHAADIEVTAGVMGEMHLGDGLSAGIAPIDATGRTHNVTLVADAARYGREIAAEPVAFFRRSLERFPRLRDRARQARLLPQARRNRGGPLLASGPFDRPTRRIVAPGFALVGDAAGYYDPFTGQGLYQALAGARLLAAEAEPALRCDSGPVLLVSYPESQRKLVRGARRLQHIIEAVTQRPWLADLAIGRLARRPLAGRALLAATGDLEPPFRALSPAVLLRFLAPWPLETLRT
jgi:flavin-dependent dehydrogenase